MSWLKWKARLSGRLPLDGPSDGSRRMSIGRSKIQVGRFSYGFEKAWIRQWGEGASLEAGAFCSFGRGLNVFLGGDHRLDWSTTFPFGHVFSEQLGVQGIVGHPASRGDIVIGNDVWIGMNVTVMSGVTIGDGAVIAANSTVGKSVGPYEIWGGNPARLIKPRFAEDIIRRLHALRWWECSVGAIREMAPLLSTPPDHAVLDRLEEIVARDRA